MPEPDGGPVHRATTRQQARLQVISGPMFAGKSEELLRRVRRARLAGLALEVVNHALDERTGHHLVASHAGLSIPSRALSEATAIATLAGSRSLDLVTIDEAQFFGPGLVPVVTALVAAGTTVAVAGLSVTLDGRPFEPLPELMALAEDVTKLTAVCTVCGADAAFHQRMVPGPAGDVLLPTAEHIGGADAYQARCRRHFQPSRP
ncbi:thymidine kinase [Arthrobacter sp. JSM 101049]|uniref:thymidine kinase n=1 Tax=Arthrobacter sp. JSM 101049 TaxID=929097 RepID=UPI003561E9C2